MTDIVAPAPEGKYMVDTYENWARAEGVPVHEGFALDLAALATKPWARMGIAGAMCHLSGRCDYLTMWLLDIPGSGKSEPQRHLFDAVFHVVSGHGAATVEAADGVSHTFEFGPRAVFAVPMNARYRLSASGSERARIAVVSDFRYVLNLFRNEQFLFANPTRFDRGGMNFKIANTPSSHTGVTVLETSLVADAANCELAPSPEAGTRARSLQILPPDGILGIEVSELPGGATGTARKFLPGTAIFAMTGSGHTRYWVDGESEVERVDWRPGVVFAPGLQVVHQHVNTGSAPARLLGVQYGSLRYPMARDKALAFGGRLGRI
jgi:mannose-6-phosphate isomerase-like protein (cupin superfamily)